jgi:nucleotide-binding universal stress UspA family protein
MSIQRIVAATDFSPEAELAARQAMKIALHTGASLTLLHAFSQNQLEQIWMQHALARPEIIRELLETANAHIRQRLDDAQRQLSGHGVKVSTLVVDAPEPAGVCDGAASLEADLVVVGAGRHRLLIGGTAERVVRGCDCDVLVARGEAGTTAGFRRILVPVDFSPRSLRALEMARELAAQGGAIEIQHVHQLPAAVAIYDGLGVAAEGVVERMSLIERERCQQLAAASRDPRFEVTGRVVTGSPRSTMVAHANQGGFDLVVVGSHGRRHVSRFLLGSVAEAVVRGATCSVLVTHGETPRQG